MKKMFIVLTCICLFIAYFLYISYYSLDITFYEIESSKITQDINIVMIADIHDQHCHIKEKMIHKIKELNPDLILCVGDMIDNQSENEENTIQLLKSLRDITDVYMSIGNHELEYDESLSFIDEIEDIGVHILDKEYMDIEVNNNLIRIGGLYDYAFQTYDGKITKESMHNSATYQFLNTMAKSSLFKIMMSHRPDSFIFGEADQWDIDLILSGHLHGGQMILPFVGGLYAPDQGWFPQYDYGEYDLRNSKLIITRGVSSSGELLPRFNNSPEIVRIVLKKRS